MAESPLLNEIRTAVHNAYANYRHTAAFPIVHYLLHMAAFVAMHPSKGHSVDYRQLADQIFKMVEDVAGVKKAEILAKLDVEEGLVDNALHYDIRINMQVIKAFRRLLGQAM